MSTIIPYSSLLARCKAPTVQDFPSIKAFFHEDDAVVGQTTFASRFGGLVATSDGGIVQKDAGGMFWDTIVALTYTGDVSVKKYPFAISTGHTIATGTTTQSIAGIAPNSTVGTSSSTAPGGASFGTAAILASTANTNMCHVSQYDCVAASPSGTNQTHQFADGDAAVVSGAVTYTGNLTTLSGVVLDKSDIRMNNSPSVASGQRTNCFAIMDFNTPLPVGLMQKAVVWMAKNRGYLYPGLMKLPVAV